METERSTDTDERLTALEQLDEWIERPMVILGLTWLALMILELTRGLSPVLDGISIGIWVIFILEFLLRLSLAPEKSQYLRRNWLSALALVVPAFRVLRFARVARIAGAARASRSLRLVRIVTSLNRGMKSLRSSMHRRGFGYVAVLSVLVTIAGAAGMHAFERHTAVPGFVDFPSALWWTAMLMTTLGSDFWPATMEGRMLCLLLSLYAFGVWGYITASLATFFVGRDAVRSDGEIASQASIDLLHIELVALRSEVRSLGRQD